VRETRERAVSAVLASVGRLTAADAKRDVAEASLPQLTEDDPMRATSLKRDIGP
jgi:hypothetical protein